MSNDNDPFGRPAGGNFPKPDDIEGLLVMLRPVEVETVPNKFDKDGSKPTVERATADTVVWNEDGEPEEYEEMYWSQGPLVSACKRALKPGKKPFILGRLVKVATKDTQKDMGIGNTAEDFTAARAKWLKNGGKGKEPRHAWVLAEYSDEDAQLARDFIAAQTAASDKFAGDTDE